MKPNVFHYATSELSQDAIFLWLINWAKPEYKTTNEKMHNLGCAFVRLLIDKDIPITSIQTRKQEKNMDITVDINNAIYLVVEDKVGSGTHGDQLSRYKKTIQEKYGHNRELCFVYIKTENESFSKLRKIQSEEQYRVINREDIIALFREHEDTILSNDIISDYFDCLLAKQKATDAYKTLPYKEWTDATWQGLFMELEQRLGDDAEWKRVSNPKGGFWGLCWNFTKESKIPRMFLQIEENGKLCIKVEGKSYRDQYCTLLKNHIASYPEIKFSARRYGQTMTIAYVDPDTLYGSECVNINLLVERLLRYEELINTIDKENL